MLFASIFKLSLFYEMVLTLDLNHGLVFTNLSKPLRPHVFLKPLAARRNRVASRRNDDDLGIRPALLTLSF